MVRIPPPVRTFRLALGAAVLLVGGARPAAAQQEIVAVTRDAAVAASLGRGVRVAVAAADTALASARLRTARARPDPLLATSYSQSAPQYHVDVELPLDLPGLRGARIGAAMAGREAARWRFAAARAALALEADTLYTRALAARDRARLSSRTAAAADTLRRIAERRRDAGDASDLDVELAMVNAGQAANVAAADALDYQSLLLDLQLAMGLGADSVAIVPTDSLVLPGDPAAPANVLPAASAAAPPPNLLAEPLAIAAARSSLAAASLSTRLQRRSVFAQPSLTAGFETGDPGGAETGILPTVGIAIPLPLFDRNRGQIAEAAAAESQARAELAQAQLETRTELARLRRERAVALEKVTRSITLVDAAERVATRSLTAYREGAIALPGVLEAQRNARELLAQSLDDLAALWIADAELRALTLTPETALP